MNDIDDFGRRFKTAVERNFDQSVDLYELFESRHRLFDDITRRLCEAAAPLSPRRILDVGCGTGISTAAILNAFPTATDICGLDLSEIMLEKARARMAGVPAVAFAKGDAERLADYFTEPFDAVFYAASIFLIPDFQRSVSQACELLRPGGFLLISFYDGLFDARGADAFARVFPDRSYRYGAVRYGDLEACLGRQKGLLNRRVDYRREIDKVFLRDFLTIPAQSAGLFPKIPYPERAKAVAEVVEKLTAEVSPLFMGWKLLVSTKS